MFELVSRIRQGEEPTRREALIAEPAVEALDERVLHGLPRTDEEEMHPTLKGLGIERAARELRPVVTDQRRWESTRRD
jgi:hypothetical protein